MEQTVLDSRQLTVLRNMLILIELWKILLTKQTVSALQQFILLETGTKSEISALTADATATSRQSEFFVKE